MPKVLRPELQWGIRLWQQAAAAKQPICTAAAGTEHRLVPWPVECLLLRLDLCQKSAVILESVLACCAHGSCGLSSHAQAPRSLRTAGRGTLAACRQHLHRLALVCAAARLQS